MHKTPITPRMSPKTPLGHSAEETLNLILDGLNVWTLQLSAGYLIEWMDRPSFASPGHEVIQPPSSPHTRTRNGLVLSFS